MPRHHSYVTRMLVRLFAAGDLSNVQSVEVEPEFGQVARVTYRGGDIRLIKGNDVGLNSWAAIETLRDKEFTKFLLRSSGYRCPAGRSFALPWWAETLGPSLARRGYDGLVTTADAVEFAEGLGFPVYAKPVDGAHGTGVTRCHEAIEIEETVARYEVLRVKTMLVEEAIDLPDYRIVVLDDEVISAYRRRPLAVRGDGVSTIADLIERRQDDFRATGRRTRLDAADPRIVSFLAHSGRTTSTVPAAGEQVTLLPVSNLSAGGTAEDVTTRMAACWRELAVAIAASLGPRFCGVDLSTSDIERDGDYAVLEVNGCPGLDHYQDADVEPPQRVSELYARVLNALP